MTTSAGETSWLSQRQRGMGRIPSGAVTGSDRAPVTIKILLQVAMQDIRRLPYFEGWLPGAVAGERSTFLSRRGVGDLHEAIQGRSVPVSCADAPRCLSASRSIVSSAFLFRSLTSSVRSSPLSAPSLPSRRRR
jgi:hypothetical protein